MKAKKTKKTKRAKKTKPALRTATAEETLPAGETPAAEQMEAKEKSIWELTATGQRKFSEITKKERERWLKIASAATDHNNALIRAVWSGKKPKSALAWEDEGGELKRVGWPEGYKPNLDRNTTKLASPRASRQRAPVPTDLDGKKVKLLVKENPKKAGSAGAARFALYQNGMTVPDFITAGGSLADVKWDVAHSYIALE